MVTRHQRISADRQGLFLGDIEKCAIVADAQFDIKTRTSLHGQNNGQSGRTRHMPYVMPQQVKKKRPAIIGLRESTGLDITFC